MDRARGDFDLGVPGRARASRSGPLRFHRRRRPLVLVARQPPDRAEPEIILCPHDESEAEIFAPTFAAWLFRICLEYGTALEAASDGKEERRRLESWAEIVETAGAGEMAGRLRQIAAAPGTEIVTPIGRETALASAELIETSLRELLGPVYLETRVEWTADA